MERRNYEFNLAVDESRSIYFTGGTALREAQKSTLVFDIETEEFEEAADMNIQRYKHGSIVIAGRLYVFGGWISDKVPTSSIEMLTSRFATEW